MTWSIVQCNEIKLREECTFTLLMTGYKIAVLRATGINEFAVGDILCMHVKNHGNICSIDRCPCVKKGGD